MDMVQKLARLATQRERLDEAMRASGTNPTEMARALGFTPTYVRDFMTDRKKSMSAAAWRAIAAHLAVDVGWLMAEPAAEAEAPAVPARDLATEVADAVLARLGEFLVRLIRQATGAR